MCVIKSVVQKTSWLITGVSYQANPTSENHCLKSDYPGANHLKA